MRIVFESNDNLRIGQLNEIIRLKKQYWDYSRIEHENWIKKNIKNDENHLMIYDSNNKLIAYLNVINTIMSYKNFQSVIYGIGNVCVDRALKGKDLGRLLMAICDYYLSSDNRLQALFCKPGLVKFYENTGWEKYEGNVVVNGKESQQILMLNKVIDIDEISIERNF